MMNFDPLTEKLQVDMLTHPISTLCMLCGIIQLRSGHVTSWRAEFQSPKLSPQSVLWHQAASRWALHQIFSY